MGGSYRLLQALQTMYDAQDNFVSQLLKEYELIDEGGKEIEGWQNGPQAGFFRFEVAEDGEEGRDELLAGGEEVVEKGEEERAGVEGGEAQGEEEEGKQEEEEGEEEEGEEEEALQPAGRLPLAEVTLYPPWMKSCPLCQERDTDKMISCSTEVHGNESELRWYHYSCVELADDTIPEGEAVGKKDTG